MLRALLQWVHAPRYAHVLLAASTLLEREIELLTFHSIEAILVASLVVLWLSVWSWRSDGTSQSTQTMQLAQLIDDYKLIRERWREQPFVDNYGQSWLCYHGWTAPNGMPRCPQSLIKRYSHTPP